MLAQKKFIVVIAFMVVLVSFLSLSKIRKLEDPILNLPFYNITILAPGATNLTLEKDIVSNLKDELSDVDDILETTYHIQDNYFSVKLEAEATVDVDDKLSELKRVVNGLVLPDYVKKSIVKKVNPLDVNIVQLAIHQKDTVFDYRLNTVASTLKNKLENIKGVNGVSLNGERKRIVAITIDNQKLQATRLPVRQIISKIEDRFSITPTGKVGSDIFSLSVKTSYGFEGINDLKKLVISNDNGQILYLKDIATVKFTEDVNNKYYTQIDDYPCIFITATAKKDADLFYISEEVSSIVDAFTKNNKGINIDTIFDQSESVDGKLSDLTWNILQGILLIFVLIYFILGVRNAMIAGIIIPIAIVSAVGLLYFLGFALQQISIAALIISIGLVIDDNIVIIENIHRLLNDGHSKVQAIKEGVKSILWPVINSSVTTALVFFPMMNLGGRTGQYIKTLPITVCLCLFTSLLFSIVLTPILCHFLLLKDKREGKMERMLNILSSKYLSLLDKVLKHPLVSGVSILTILVLSVFLFKAVGVSLFPPADKPILLVDVEMPKGVALKNTEIVGQKAVSIIKATYPEASCALNIGHGNPKLYYNISPKRYNENYAQIIVFLKEWKSETFQKTKKEIQKMLQESTKAKITIAELVNGPPIASPIEIKLLSNEATALGSEAKKVMELLHRDPEIHSINSPLDDEEFTYHLTVDLSKTSKLGLSNTEINRNLYMMLSGYEVNDLNISGEDYPIKVLLGNNESSKNTYNNVINHLSVQSNITKTYIPYQNFAKLNLTKEANAIEYYDGKRAFTITCNVVNGVNVLEKTEEIIDRVKTLRLDNVELSYGGEYKTSKKSFGGVLIVLVIALLAIYSVLVLQFKSYHQPFIVLMAIPLAFVGAIFLLFISNQTFSFLAFIGFTSISGIVINNSMLLVDTYNNLSQSKGYNRLEAIRESAKQRFLPILITSITTIFGLLPMIFSGSNLWKPLALTIVGGMLSSTFLVLILIPILLNNTHKFFNKNA